MTKGEDSKSSRSLAIFELLRKSLLVLTLLSAAMLLSACTTEQLYQTGQGYQRNQCSRLPDKADYDRCMREREISYDSYRQSQPLYR
jgi:hypothetical protein